MGTIRKRKSKSGKITFNAQVRIKGHPPVTKTFSKKTHARAWVDETEASIQAGLYLKLSEVGKYTMDEAFKRYKSEVSSTSIRLTHLKRWQEEIGSYFVSALNEIRINDVTSKWTHKGLNGKKLSGSTLNRHLDSLSVVFRAAKEWGWIERNPVSEAKRYQEPKGRVRFLSVDEQDAMLKACKESYYKPLYFIVVLALSTGMRKNELRWLNWDDVDLKTGTIILKKTKNKARRRVEVQGLALELLREHAKVRRIDTPFLFPAQRDSQKPNCSKVSVSERPMDFRKAWIAALKKAEIEDFTFHDLRHSCASYLAMNGASLLEIAEVLGHKQVEVVKRYAHLSETHIKGVMADLSKKIFGQ